MNQQEVATLIADCLKKGRRIYPGRILGAANADSRVSVRVNEAVPKYGSIISATALNDCLGGEVVVMLTDKGKWVALSGVESREPVVQTVTHRHTRKRENKGVVKGNVAILFIKDVFDRTEFQSNIIITPGSRSVAYAFHGKYYWLSFQYYDPIHSSKLTSFTEIPLPFGQPRNLQMGGTFSRSLQIDDHVIHSNTPYAPGLPLVKAEESTIFYGQAQPSDDWKWSPIFASTNITHNKGNGIEYTPLMLCFETGSSELPWEIIDGYFDRPGNPAFNEYENINKAIRVRTRIIYCIMPLGVSPPPLPIIRSRKIGYFDKPFYSTTVQHVVGPCELEETGGAAWGLVSDTTIPPRTLGPSGTIDFYKTEFWIGGIFSKPILVELPFKVQTYTPYSNHPGDPALSNLSNWHISVYKDTVFVKLYFDLTEEPLNNLGGFKIYYKKITVCKIVKGVIISNVTYTYPEEIIADPEDWQRFLYQGIRYQSEPETVPSAYNPPGQQGSTGKVIDEPPYVPNICFDEEIWRETSLNFSPDYSKVIRVLTTTNNGFSDKYGKVGDEANSYKYYDNPDNLIEARKKQLKVDVEVGTLGVQSYTISNDGVEGMPEDHCAIIEKVVHKNVVVHNLKEEDAHILEYSAWED